MPYTAPGDVVRADVGRLAEIIEPSPHRATPVCRHFGTCGGCALQHLDEQTYRTFKRGLVVHALAQRGIENPIINDPIVVAPKTRRRAALKAAKQNGDVKIGFNARASHAIVDMRECHVLTPGIFALTIKLRPLMHSLLREGEQAELHITEADNGFDLSLKMKRANAPAVVSQIAQRAQQMGIVRVTSGTEPLAEFEAPHLNVANADIRLPPECFLQATREAEHALQNIVLEAAGNARHIADLFCGIGTFSLPLGLRARVHAADADAAMIEALTTAARGVQGLKPFTPERRDLFRRPLVPTELNKFDTIVLDPPRAGAAAQIEQIAKSKAARVIYVSCNPASFARDARTLVDAGYRLGPVTSVDQFLWSAQLELAATFEK